MTAFGKLIGERKALLNPAKLKSLPCGHHSDGHGLFLSVVERGGAVERIWAFRFTDLEGKRQRMEFARLGDRDSDLKDVLCLSGARQRVREFKVDLKDGVDPRVKKRLDTKGSITFKAFADSQYPDWCKGKSAEEEKQWERSIADMHHLHDMKVHEIETENVLTALKTIWTKKPITADRTRQRLERLFDAAKAIKLRTGENPASWRGNLKHLLPSPRKLNRAKRGGKPKGHASVPYAKAPALMTELSYDTGTSARCTEVGILTVTRSKEVRLMEWEEIDFDRKQWLIPGEKMKIKGEDQPKPHLVPLSDQCIEIIKSMPRVGRYVFPSDKVEEHQPFFANALANCIKRAGFNATMHGMRSTFRNWGADAVEHNFRREVLEFCLSHRVGDEAELSYWNSEMIGRRRVALQAWADYVKPRGKAKAEPPRLRLVESAA